MWSGRYNIKGIKVIKKTGFSSPVTTPPSATVQGTRCGCRPAWFQADRWDSVCYGPACWCRCGEPACTAPLGSGSRVSRSSYCRGSSPPPPTCQHTQLFNENPLAHSILKIYLGWKSLTWADCTPARYTVCGWV